MGRTAVLVMVLAASLALAPLERAQVRNLPGWVSISVEAGRMSAVVWTPINSIGIGDIIDAIIRELSQLIDK